MSSLMATRRAGRLVARTLEHWWSTARKARRAGDARAEISARLAGLRSWSRAMNGVFGVELSVEGRPPEPPFFLVSNHLGYLDIFVLGEVLAPVFVAKSEIGRWPLLGALTRVGGTLFIDRSRIRDIPRVMREIDEVGEKGAGVALFAEGTTSDGREIGPFRSPLLEAAARACRPVHVAYIEYATPEGFPPASEVVCWYGSSALLGHLPRLLRVPRVAATLRFAEECVVDEDRKRLASRARDLMVALRERPAPEPR